MITWIDKKSSLSAGSKNYRFGDIIPSGILSDSRILFFQSKGKISVPQEAPEAPKEEKPVKTRGRKTKQHDDDLVSEVVDEIISENLNED